IRVISEKTGLPLVLHGGSGLSDDDFRTAIKEGICKINIFTDIDKAGKRGIEQGLAEGATSMMGLIPYEIAAMKEVVREKMELFGSVGKAARNI
ncbi:MAG: class II fructose-bisphosphate aldolase, partial [Parasporobacterium sp.]|nr:class II fructose-bisphosphate aldolase [Parasporobacterium sp.]